MPVGNVISIQTGRIQTLSDDAHDESWTTAFFKTPVDGPVSVTALGLARDEVADTENHGGIDKAVLCYSADHVPAWGDELPSLDVSPGAFGENLTITGLTEHDVCIGDVWSTGGVYFEVSQPRQPCWKLGRRHDQKDLPKRVVKNGRSGWYVRVIEEGALEAGQTLSLVERPNPGWTVSRANEMFYRKDADPTEVQALAVLPQLAAAWKHNLRTSR